MKKQVLRFENLEFEVPRTDESGTNEETKNVDADDNNGIAEGLDEVQGPEAGLDFGSEEVAVKMESYANQLATALDLRNAVGNGRLTPTSVAMAHYHLDQLQVHVPALVRMEGQKDETNALRLRCEGVIDTLWGKIVSFWEWLVEKVKSIFKSKASTVTKEEVKAVEKVKGQIVEAIVEKLGEVGNKPADETKKSVSDDTPISSLWGLERVAGGSSISEILSVYKGMDQTSASLKAAAEAIFTALDHLKSKIGQADNGDIGATNSMAQTSSVLEKANQRGVLDKVNAGKNGMTVGMEAGFGKVLAFGAPESGTGFVGRTLSYEVPGLPDGLTAQNGKAIAETAMNTLTGMAECGSYFSDVFLDKAEEFAVALKKSNPKNKELPQVLAKSNSMVSALVRASEAYGKNSRNLLQMMETIAKKNA